MYRAVIVEDDPMVAAINRQYLEKSSRIKIVGEFRNGKDALDFLKKTPVDLAVIDYYMPVMDGMTFLQMCRAEKIKTDMIMVTAANTPQEIAAFLQLGIVDYLVKPFTFERFQKAIDRYIQRKELTSREKSLSQEEIDRMLASNAPADAKPELEKGLQEQTLEKIRAYLEAHSETPLSSNEIAAATDLSRITVRRYMNYLVENREIISQMDYSTGGRPSIKYRKN